MVDSIYENDDYREDTTEYGTRTPGKPKGTLQKSKFDADLERIKELLILGLSVRKIVDLLGYNNHLALNTYITKRQLHEPVPERMKKPSN